jgi:hypothetical protein
MQCAPAYARPRHSQSGPPPVWTSLQIAPSVTITVPRIVDPSPCLVRRLQRLPTITKPVLPTMVRHHLRAPPQCASPSTHCMDTAARCCTRFTARGGATRGDSLKIQTRRSSCRAAHSSRRHTHTISRRTQSLAAAHAHASHHSIERDGNRRPRGVASNRRGGWRPITDTDIARTRGCADSAETRHFAQSAHPG